MAHVRSFEKTVLDQARAVAHSVVRRAAMEYVHIVQNLMRTSPATGRVYVINGKPHRASAPGEPPAVLTGELVKSATYEVVDTPQGPMAMAGSGLETGRAGWLEFGTTSILPRPAWRPALPLAVKKINEIIASEGGADRVGGRVHHAGPAQ